MDFKKLIIKLRAILDLESKESLQQWLEMDRQRRINMKQCAGCGKNFSSDVETFYPVCSDSCKEIVDFQIQGT